MEEYKQWLEDQIEQCLNDDDLKREHWAFCKAYEKFAKLSPIIPDGNERLNDKMNNKLYRKIPILITKWNDNGIKGWRAEIPDNHETYKPACHDDINFEDLSHHFNHNTETHPDDHLVFSTRKAAIEAAKYCNEKYTGGKAKIWFI